MKHDLKFEFLVDETTSSITINREFAAKRNRVWDCYTKAELLDRWFAPKPLTTKTKTMDFREGGHWHYAMVEPGGTEHWNRLDYRTIRPIDGFTALDGFADASGNVNAKMPRSNWDVTFAIWPRIVACEQSFPMPAPKTWRRSSRWVSNAVWRRRSNVWTSCFLS